MKLRTIVLIICCCTLLSTICPAQENASRMDEIVQSYVSRKQFMGSVLIVRDQTVLFNKGYGSANLEWNIPNDSTTKFRLGSVTKQFTAASILLLEDRGKLKVDDPVKKYLPNAPAAWDKVTIYHLLTHTSGIPSFTEFPDYAPTEAIPTTPEKLVARFRNKPLEFQPGDKFKYSNSGYVLLGYLIEKVSGQTYSQFVEENIFKPLKMQDSGYDSNSAIIPHRASGYTPDGIGIRNTGYVDMTIPFSAGALYSTTEDLVRWEQGLYGGKLLSAASLQKMTTPAKDNYAMGLTVSTENGHRKFSHGGGIEGFNTSLAYYPDDKLAVVVLGNLNGGAPDQIAHQLGDLVHGQQVVLPTERKEVTVSPDTLAKYVGVYELAPGFDLAVTLEGTQLMTQATGQPKLPVYAEAQNKFFLKVVDAQLEFFADDKGKVTHVMLHQNGLDMKAMKKSDKVAPSPVRTEISVAPSILQKYVGDYELAPGIVISMTLENGQLMTQATGQPKFPMYAETESKFFLKVVDAQVEFFKDETGAVTYAILHQGGRDMRAAKK